MQLTNLAKSFSIFFIGVTILWSVVSLVALGDVYVTWRIFFLNLLVSALLGWRFYKNRYHAVFSYDGGGFELRRGKSTILANWRDFSTVSLVRSEHGDFSIRLYKDEKDYVEIPASELKLDPLEFRFAVTRFVKGE